MGLVATRGVSAAARVAAFFKTDLSVDLVKGFVRFFGNRADRGDRMDRLEFVVVYTAAPAP